MLQQQLINVHDLDWDYAKLNMWHICFKNMFLTVLLHTPWSQGSADLQYSNNWINVLVYSVPRAGLADQACPDPEPEGSSEVFVCLFQSKYFKHILNISMTCLAILWNHPKPSPPHHLFQTLLRNTRNLLSTGHIKQTLWRDAISNDSPNRVKHTAWWRWSWVMWHNA